MILYHYTSKLHHQQIVQEGKIDTTDSNLSLTVSEPQVVWFMNHPNPRLVHGNHMLESFSDKTEFRIVVDVDAQRWDDWAPLQEGYDPEWAEILNRVGGYTRRNWYITTEPVDSDKWLRVEQWNGERYK